LPYSLQDRHEFQLELGKDGANHHQNKLSTKTDPKWINHQSANKKSDYSFASSRKTDPLNNDRGEPCKQVRKTWAILRNCTKIRALDDIAPNSPFGDKKLVGFHTRASCDVQTKTQL
jgi:hypothetical protein